jgi:thiol-disulfide isomerase/thioredoxin
VKKLALFVLLALGSASSSQAAPDFSKPLPLTYTAVDGRKVDLAQLRGKVVLVDFWATWCPPCRIISPDIRALYQKYHAQGFEVVGVSADSDKQALVDFVKKENEPWPQYFDDAGDNKLLESMGIDSFPTLWLVDKKGVVVDSDFRHHWVIEGSGIPSKTSPETIKTIEGLIEQQLNKS